MNKGKIWYVKKGIWYEGYDLVGIFATYEEACERYKKLLNKIKNNEEHCDYCELWEANLYTQEYNEIDSWSRDDDGLLEGEENE